MNPQKYFGFAWAILVLGGSAGMAADVEVAAPANSTEASGEETFRLEFRNQPWLEALQWFAEKSQLNLDWQSLPEGELNLSAQEAYSLPEVRDVLNMQLLVRGFTLLERGDVLRVVPLENLDPTLVSRVRPEDLETLPTHQFVRVSFALDWMVADEAATELRPLLSPYGKLIPLGATNRLEAMDAVVNLREIQRLLAREQSDAGKKRLVEEFRLEHRRATDVASMLRDLLGLDNSRYRRAGERMQLALERTKLQSQAVEKLGDKATRFLKDEPDVNLVVNDEENSILVHAPPDKVEVIRQAIESLDRPSERGDSAWENINRVKVYKIANVAIESIQDLVREMQDLGRLDDETRIEVDERNDTIIAYATPEDHLTLAHLVRSFEQEPREAHVLQLGVLDPRYAVEAVRVLFTQNGDSDDYWRRRRYGGSDEEEFRVEADQQHSRLLLWATATEFARVKEYLGDLGEQTAVATGRQGVRVLSTGSAEFADIESKLRAVWASVSDAPLVIHPQGEPRTPTGASREAAPAEDSDAAADAQREGRRADRPGDTTSSDASVRTASLLQVAASDDQQCTSDEDQVVVVHALHQAADEAEVEAPAASPSDQPAEAGQPAPVQQAEAAPVRVIAGPDGKLIVVSDDPAAAQLMTELLESLLPEQKDVHVFPLKYASALSVEFQIHDLLGLDEDYRDEEQPDALGASQQQMVVYSDGRTNRLLVRHASEEQLQAIRDLIDVLDQPEEVEPQLARKQWLYKVRYKDATELSETVKEVYRDLLSSTDKAFSGRDERSSRTAGYWGFASARSTVPEYQGLLSVGVDLTSNSLVVSAPQYLMEEVKELVQSLDQQPSAQSISIMRLQNGATDSVREALSQVLGESGQNGRRREWRGR